MTDEDAKGAQEQGGRVRPLFWLARLVAGLLGSVLLVALVLPSVLARSFRTDCSRSKTRADLQALASAIESYAIDHDGAFPSSLLDLVTPDENGFRYLRTETVPRDRWGREYQYFPPDVLGPEPVVRSLGSDGVPGGQGEAQDIDNLALRSGTL